MSKKNNNKENKSEDEKVVDEKVVESEGKKTAKYFVKSEKEIGFKKRNYFIASTNKKYLIVADAEIDEKTYNLFGDKAKKIFFK